MTAKVVGSSPTLATHGKAWMILILILIKHLIKFQQKHLEAITSLSVLPLFVKQFSLLVLKKVF